MANLDEILNDVREAGGKVGACKREEIKTKVAEKRENINISGRSNTHGSCHLFQRPSIGDRPYCGLSFEELSR